jgi:hypothetical protein
MIGAARWREGGIEVVATLEDDGTVTVSSGMPAVDAAEGAALTAAYRDGNPGPADGAPGARFLAGLADRLGGTVELAEYEPDPPGTIH